MGDNQSIQGLTKMAEASESIALGDIFSNVVRGQQEWSLLRDVGLWSSICPCAFTDGFMGYPAFPKWLGLFQSHKK